MVSNFDWNRICEGYVVVLLFCGFPALGNKSTHKMYLNEKICINNTIVCGLRKCVLGIM